ncbi:dienelactone hydrolase family protein [Algihabitans albus]|uniref:dienelactone hydrolase family protein n=1 Tax=Algihabitans albus TaxID=2164067 RepID=UPI000E5CB52B|nr:dienelactone hydrolase family protein [Algihabitans albus]
MAELRVTAADGGSFGAYLAVPAKTPAPALLVIQEIFGVNQGIRDLCDWFATQGYVAASPDIFWRLEPGVELTDKTDAEWQKAFDLMKKFDVDQGVEDLKATLTALRSHESTTDRAGSVGYCLGGRLAFLMATRSDADANVSYYGVGLEGLLGELPQVSKPLMLHIASEDQFVPREAQDQITAAVADLSAIIAHVYPGADHAFAREGGAHYDAAAAQTANQRTLAFFADHLG